MASSVQKKIKFSKGQISPELVERTDLELYESSAQELINVVSTVYGGLKTRQGTELVERASSSSVEGEATSMIGGNSQHIQTYDRFVSDNIGTKREIFSIDYGKLVGNGTFVLADIKLDTMPIIHSSTSSGSFSNPTERELYLELVGGGGGGSNSYGGRGAGIKAYSVIPQGDYEYVIGAGGAGASAYVRNNNGYAGGTSSLTGSGVSVIAEGGSGRNGRRNGGGGGNCGNLSYNLNNITVVDKTINGQNIGISFLDDQYFSAGAGGQSQPNDEGSGYSGQGGLINVGLGYVNVVVRGSEDGVEWFDLTNRNVSTVGTTISLDLNREIRFIKAFINENELYDMKGTLSFSYARYINLTVSGSEVRAEPFVFNSDDKYLLLFSEGKIVVFKNDVVNDEISAPELTGDIIKEFYMAYKDDTIIITHERMKPKELRRSNAVWLWRDFEYRNIPVFAFDGEVITPKTTGITPSGLEGALKITADTAIFDENWVGNIIDGNGGRLKITEYVSGNVVNGVTIIPFYTTDKISTWDYISGYEPVWSDVRGYPITCAFAQQRLWFGGSRDLPSHLWGSRLNDYNNFKNAGNYSNDSIDVTLLTNNRIMNIVENRGLHILTSGEEWVASEANLTADTFSVVKNSQNGSSRIIPVVLSGTICFVERNGKSLLSYVYNYEQASYNADNLSLFSNLIQAPVSMCAEINSSNDKGDFLYIVQEDGTMLVACVSIPQSIFSISQFKTDGFIKDVCSVLDTTYIIVERNGVVCIEKLSDVKTDSSQKIYVSGTEIIGLDTYNGKYVYVYGDNYIEKHYVQSGVVELDKYLETSVVVGLSFPYSIESNPIAINHKTVTAKKRISKATVHCIDTEWVTFNGQRKRSAEVFDFYGCSPYSEDTRFTIRGEFDSINIMSITLNLNYEG